MFVLQTRWFCAGLWSTQRFTREGVGEAGGHWSMEGRGLCSGYRPPQPASEMPLGRV